MINRRQVLGSLLGALALSQGTVRAQNRGGVLVIGSTGRMGSRFIAQLPDSARPVTAFVRPTSNRTRLEGQDVTYAVGDVWDAESVAAAVHSARPRVVLISVQSRPGQRPMPYVGAARHVVEAARDMDVKQIFWIGQAGSSKDGVIQGIEAINYDLFTEELEAMSEGEKILIESGLPYTIIRVGAIISDGVRGVHPPTRQGRLVEDQRRSGPSPMTIWRVSLSAVSASPAASTRFPMAQTIPWATSSTAGFAAVSPTIPMESAGRDKPTKRNKSSCFVLIFGIRLRTWTQTPQGPLKT